MVLLIETIKAIIRWINSIVLKLNKLWNVISKSRSFNRDIPGSIKVGKNKMKITSNDHFCETKPDQIRLNLLHHIFFLHLRHKNVTPLIRKGSIFLLQHFIAPALDLIACLPSRQRREAIILDQLTAPIFSCRSLFLFYYIRRR